MKPKQKEHIMIKPIKIENRDPNTTELTLPDGTMIQIDPIEIFENMVLNLDVMDLAPAPIQERFDIICETIHSNWH